MDETAPYSALAEGYDFVMRHVDYASWAAHAQRLLQVHHPEARDVLELGCGTGTLARALQPLGGYRYTATDASAAMVRHAQAKAAESEAAESEAAESEAVRFAVADYTALGFDASFDAAVLLYDGLNYTLEKERVAALFESVAAALRPGGVFLFDQSTPANSLNNADYFGDEGADGAFSYVRESHYDAEARLHTTVFEITTRGGPTVREQHVQRAYRLDEIRALLAASSLEEVAAYDGFTEAPATDASERIHWLARRPA